MRIRYLINIIRLHMCVACRLNKRCLRHLCKLFEMLENIIKES